MRHLHFLATSVSVWGEYAARAADAPEELRVTYGYSKDLRPDLKQFLVQMLCCQRNIPLLGGCADGNASDKTINNAVLPGSPRTWHGTACLKAPSSTSPIRRW